MIVAIEIQIGKRQSKLHPCIFWFTNIQQLLYHTCVSIVYKLQLFLNRKLNLLSFGEEAEEEEKELAAVKMKIRSSHDVLDDPRLLKEDGSTSKQVLVDFFIMTPYYYTKPGHGRVIMLFQEVAYCSYKLILNFSWLQ